MADVSMVRFMPNTVFPAGPSKIKHSMLADSDEVLEGWDINYSTELLAELNDMTEDWPPQQQLPTRTQHAEGDVSHTVNWQQQLDSVLDSSFGNPLQPNDIALWAWHGDTLSTGAPTGLTDARKLNSNLLCTDKPVRSTVPLCRAQALDQPSQTIPCSSEGFGWLKALLAPSQGAASPAYTRVANVMTGQVSDARQPAPTNSGWVDLRSKGFNPACAPQPSPSGTAIPADVRFRPVQPSCHSDDVAPLPRPPSLRDATRRALRGVRQTEALASRDSPAQPMCKRAKLDGARKPSALAENERRRVANMSPNRLEHVRQLSREAARRRKAKHRQTLRQLQHSNAVLEETRVKLETEQSRLQVHRQRLYTALQ
jgi:hypothetical protein